MCPEEVHFMVWPVATAMQYEKLNEGRRMHIRKAVCFLLTKKFSAD